MDFGYLSFENPAGAGASQSDFENPSGAGASQSDFVNLVLHKSLQCI